MWSELCEWPAVYPAFARQAARGTHCLRHYMTDATILQTMATPKLGSLDFALAVDLADPKTRLIPHVLSCRIWSFYRSNCNVIKDIRLKYLIPRVPPSRSLKVIRTDTDRSVTRDFLLTFHSNRNHESVSYRFRDKRRFHFSRKFHIFHIPCI